MSGTKAREKERNPSTEAITNGAQDEEYFYDQVMVISKDIVKDCKKVVDTVMNINEVQEDDPEQQKIESMKEAFVLAVKRVPQTANSLVQRINLFVKENKEFYAEDDKVYMPLFRLLEQSAKTVKESVLNLVRLATVSVRRTKTAATTSRTQGLLKTHCESVVNSIKAMVDAAERLKNREEEEEREWIEQEAAELTKLITNKSVGLARHVTALVKDLTELTREKSAQESAFVKKAKEVGNCLTSLIGFANSLGLKEEELREATYKLLVSAKQAFKTKSEADCKDLENRKNDAAVAIMAALKRIKLINTREIILTRLMQEESDHKIAKQEKKVAETLKTEQTKNETNAPKEEEPENRKQLVQSKAAAANRAPTIRLTREQMNTLQEHLKHQAPEMMTARRPKMRTPRTTMMIDLKSYEPHLFKIIKLQRRVRRWLRVHRFRTAALDFLISPESERLRKRNMALWEILYTERTYVNQLEELDRTIIQPMKSEMPSFINDDQIEVLFSNLESILCLNLQLLERMETRMEAWPSDGRLADLIVNKIPVLRLYTDYINNYERQLEVLLELEKRPVFKEWMKSKNPKINMGNFLILPVQRIPRYEILLENLLKYTPEYHLDYKNIKMALEKVHGLNTSAEQRRKDDDNRKKINEIQKSISGAVPSLLVAHRQFCKEGLLDVVFSTKKEKKERLYIYLFNDIILLTKLTKKTKIAGAFSSHPKTKFQDMLHFKDRWAVDKASEGPNSFKLTVSNGTQWVLFSHEDASQVESWATEIERVQKGQVWKKILYSRT